MRNAILLYDQGTKYKNIDYDKYYSVNKPHIILDKELL